jgi:hypothetical protein
MSQLSAGLAASFAGMQAGSAAEVAAGANQIAAQQARSRPAQIGRSRAACSTHRAASTIEAGFKQLAPAVEADLAAIGQSAQRPDDTCVGQVGSGEGPSMRHQGPRRRSVRSAQGCSLPDSRDSPRHSGPGRRPARSDHRGADVVDPDGARGHPCARLHLRQPSTKGLTDPGHPGGAERCSAGWTTRVRPPNPTDPTNPCGAKQVLGLLEDGGSNRPRVRSSRRRGGWVH